MATEQDFLNFSLPGTSLRKISGGTVASAIAMAAPTGLIMTVSGTVEITSIALPFPEFEGIIILIPTGAFTGNTGGAAGIGIGVAFTAVVGRPLIMVYSKAAGLWYPHAIA